LTEDPVNPPSDETDGAPATAAAATAPVTYSATGPRAGADLSREIEHTVDRQPGDQIKCTRVGGDTYRCNWWCVTGGGGYDNPSMKGGQLATDHRIRKSAFLRVTKARKGLQITVVA
jgi:hypothetical protein